MSSRKDRYAAGLIIVRTAQDKYAVGNPAVSGNGNGNGNCVPFAKGERLAEVWSPQDTPHQAVRAQQLKLHLSESDMQCMEISSCFAPSMRHKSDASPHACMFW